MPHDFAALNFLQAFYANIQSFNPLLFQLRELFLATEIDGDRDYDPLGK